MQFNKIKKMFSIKPNKDNNFEPDSIQNNIMVLKGKHFQVGHRVSTVMKVKKIWVIRRHFT